MPDANGKFRGISVPEDAWTRIFGPALADDPAYDEYVSQAAAHDLQLRHGAHTNMIEALNCGAGWAVDQSGHVGFMGDDHRPRTPGWDVRYLDTLRGLGWGWVYGNDLLQGANLPTQFAMSSDIVRVLGFMVPPQLKHLFADNYVLKLGTQAGRLRYLDDVIVEHMHPVNGKAAWDDGYKRVNSGEVWGHDQAVFDQYDFTDDLRQLRRLMPA